MKMSNVKVRNRVSQRTEGETFFETFQKLLKQRAQLDRQILQMEVRLVKKLAKKGAKSASRKKYVPRQHNQLTLIEAIRKCMVPGKEMNMNAIISSLKKSGLYGTSSTYFYTMVNNKLNRDKKIRKSSRGVFVLRKSKTRSASRKIPARAA